MDYATLRSSVESAMGRSDVPSYVYTLTTAGVNRDCRFLDMEKSATVSTDTGALPSDFHSIVSAYVDYADEKFPLKNVPDQAVNMHRNDHIPRYFSVTDGVMKFSPESASGTYTVNIQYIAKLADFSLDSDTNDVITRYPDLYLYQALTHAAIWVGGDQAREASYGNAYAAALRLARQDDKQRRLGLPVASRNVRL